jgi:hypothetical protein
MSPRRPVPGTAQPQPPAPPEVQSLHGAQQPVSGVFVHIPPGVGQSSWVQRLPSSH